MKKRISNFLKFFLIIFTFFFSPDRLFAQADVRGQLNTVMNDYGLPIFIFIIVISVGTGLVTNMDKIIDKNGDGTRKEGIINVMWYLVYTILTVVVIAGVIMLLNSQLSLSI
jgi:hypothetical protein